MCVLLSGIGDRARKQSRSTPLRLFPPCQLVIPRLARCQSSNSASQRRMAAPPPRPSLYPICTSSIVADAMSADRRHAAPHSFSPRRSCLRPRRLRIASAWLRNASAPSPLHPAARLTAARNKSEGRPAISAEASRHAVAAGGRKSPDASLTDLDLRILDLLSSQRVLTSPQLAALSPGSQPARCAIAVTAWRGMGSSGERGPTANAARHRIICGRLARARRSSGASRSREEESDVSQILSSSPTPPGSARSTSR